MRSKTHFPFSGELKISYFKTTLRYDIVTEEERVPQPKRNKGRQEKWTTNGKERDEISD